VNRDQLAFVKAKIAAGAEPWTTAFNRAKSNGYGSLSYRAQPRAIVECGSFNMPNNGCSDEESPDLRIRSFRTTYDHKIEGRQNAVTAGFWLVRAT
jgi:hypothetical protein